MGPDGNTDLAGYELIPEEQVAEVLKSVDLPPEVQETVEARLERRTAALNQRFPHGHQRVKGPEEVRRRRARQQRVKNPRAGKAALVKTALSHSSRSSFAARSVRVHSPSPGRQDGLSTVQNAFRRLDSCPQYRAGQSLRPGSRTQTSVLCRIITDRAMPFPSTTAPSSPPHGRFTYAAANSAVSGVECQCATKIPSREETRTHPQPARHKGMRSKMNHSLHCN